MKNLIENLSVHHQNAYVKFYESELDEFGGKVFLETHKSEFPTLMEMVDLKNDYEYSRQIDSKGILKSRKLIASPKGLLVVKEHFESIPLSTYLNQETLSIKSFFKIAIKLATILDEIHHEGVIVKNLSTKNILISLESLDIKLSNVTHASDIGKAKDNLVIQHGWEELVDYLSPEQTGRIGRSTDYRSDYYALGIIFYEMLTGGVPFKGDSILELVHAHIAITPTPPISLNKNIPEGLSNLVLKLLSKNAEKRYQSGKGLIHDLRKLKSQISEGRETRSFTLGMDDLSHIFSISEKLYGRDKELNILRDEFKKVTNGAVAISYVFGYSGIGKTRLIEELHNEISIERGFFTSGKFDQYHKETPYFAFTQAFNTLVLQLLSEENDKVVAWRNEFLKALDGRGQVLVNIAPDLEILLGEQEKIFDLGFKENQKRFISTVIDFLSVLDNEARPLVFFIDDLQWADVTSLDLISSLIGSGLRNILIIGAFRDNEVDASHPLTLQIKNFKENYPSKLSECKLRELEFEEINKLVGDSLHRKEDETSNLTEIIYNKTEGNPFFVKQFLQSLVDGGYIFYDSEEMEWTWSLDKIRDLDVTDNVVDLVVNKIQQLDQDTQQTLSLAACIGNVLDFDTLRIITQKTAPELSKTLSEIIKHGFVNPTGNWREYYAELSQSLGIETESYEDYEFKFLHDKIQQAAYSLIDTKDKERTHKQIGKLLLEQLDGEEIKENIFDILDHLNVGGFTGLNESDSNELGNLNLMAGVKAKDSNAVESALLYLENAMELLAYDSSQEAYKSALIHRCECEYLLGNYVKSEALFDKAINEASEDLDKADILSRKMIVYENIQRHPEAIEAGRQSLLILGTHFPEHDVPEIVGEEFGKVQEELEGKSIEDLLNQKSMTDPTILLTMKTLMNLWGPLYLLARQNQLAWMVLRMVRLSTQHGNSIESAVAYAFYGYVISAQMHKYEEGYKFGQLGIDLNSKIDDKSLRSKVMVIAEGCVSHWKEPYDRILPKVTSAYEIGIETNDIIYAGYAATFVTRCLVIGDKNLKSGYDINNDLLQFAVKIKHELTYEFILAWQRFIVKMADITPTAKVFGKVVDEQDHLEWLVKLSEEKGVHYYLTVYCTAQAIYHYHFGDYKKGLNYSEKILDTLHSVTGLMEFGEHPIFRLLNILGIARNNPQFLEDRLELFNSTMDIIAMRAKSCPDNYLPKYLLIKAEKAIVDGDIVQAKAHFGEVIKAAKKYNHQDVLGAAMEKMAELSFAVYDIESGLDYIDKSINAYSTWGAVAKVKKIKSRFSNVRTFSDDDLSILDSKSGIVGNKLSIDLDTILRASTAISKEVRLESLLGSLLQLLIQNAGAQNAYLFLSRDGSLVLEASSRMEEDYVSKMQNIPLKEVENVNQHIVRLAFNSGESISIDDGRHDKRFSEFFKAGEETKSVLCIPVKSGERNIAVIYLDNNLSTAAFPRERIHLLEMLSGQIAISIDNALLYGNLEQKVQERTQALEQEKQKTDDLLLNILPAEVADILKRDGHYTPRKHDSVSILFSDFEAFTKVSQMISAEELIEMLDDCYKMYDAICEKHNVEKIKTIGDSYMCVSGLPGSEKDHTARACLVGLEMLEATKKYNKERAARNLPYCAVRVGIHTGPIVAGVVGVRKFAFDIWGDSVNTASRMQSYGTPGRLNISEDTWQEIENDFECESRGMVTVKNRGDIGMYFVNREK